MFYASRTIQASRTAASVTPLQRAGTLSRAMIHMPKFVQAAIDVADEFFLHNLILFRNGARTAQSVDANPTYPLCANGQCRNVVPHGTQQPCPGAMCQGMACNSCEFPSCEKCKMCFRSRGGNAMYAIGHCAFLSAAKRRPFLTRGESGAAPEPSFAGNSAPRLPRPSGSLAMKGILSSTSPAAPGSQADAHHSSSSSRPIVWTQPTASDCKGSWARWFSWA